MPLLTISRSIPCISGMGGVCLRRSASRGSTSSSCGVGGGVWAVPSRCRPSSHVTCDACWEANPEPVDKHQTSFAGGKESIPSRVCTARFKGDQFLSVLGAGIWYTYCIGYSYSPPRYTYPSLPPTSDL